MYFIHHEYIGRGIGLLALKKLENEGRKIGTIGDATSFSFYPTKNMTTGEGGMVTTNGKGLRERLKVWELHGISKDAWKRYSAEGSWYYEVVCPGYKYNMTDIQASLGLHQLEKLNRFQRKREKIVKALANNAIRKIKSTNEDERQRGIEELLQLNVNDIHTYNELMKILKSGLNRLHEKQVIEILCIIYNNMNKNNIC